MGLITAFDSGRFTGWSQFRNGFLVACGLIHVLPDRPMNGIPACFDGLVIIEKPVHRRNGKTVPVEDLISLGIKVGRLQETYLVFENKVETVWPTDWKGGTPKDIQNRRDEKALTTNEREIAYRDMLTVAEGYRNNVWDAIGIGRWAAIRERERT